MCVQSALDGFVEIRWNFDCTGGAKPGAGDYMVWETCGGEAVREGDVVCVKGVQIRFFRRKEQRYA